MKSASNNFLAGLFTIAGIVGFVFIVLTLSGMSAFTTSRTRYVVRFTLTDGARGLKNGSDVSVGGQSVGQVKKVTFAVNEQTGAAEGVDVHIAVDSSIALFKDATVYQIKPLLGDVSVMDIPSVGTPAAGKMAAGELIKGQIAPPSFLTQAGYGDEQRNQLQQILSRGAEISTDIKKITGTVSTQIEPTMKTVTDTATDVRQVAADVKTRVNEWSPRIDTTLKNIEQFSADLSASRRLLDEGLEKAKVFISDIQSVVRDNRPRIDNTIKNVDELTTKANTELYQQVQVTLGDAQKGLKEFSQAGQRVNALMAEQTPEIRLSIANARLASDQLKLLMTEVRRNPWRLLYQPGKKELERELMYDAARSYAEAVSELRGASASLESITAAAEREGGGSGITREHLAEIQKTMQDSFAKYKQAEDKFLQMVLKDSQ